MKTDDARVDAAGSVLDEEIHAYLQAFRLEDAIASARSGMAASVGDAAENHYRGLHAYLRGDLAEAVGALTCCLSAGDRKTAHHVVRWFVLYSAVFQRAGRVDDLAVALDGLFRVAPVLNLAAPRYVPEMAPEISARRKLLTDAGVPSICFLRQQKTAGAAIGDRLLRASKSVILRIATPTIPTRIIGTWAEDLFSQGGGFASAHIEASRINLDRLAAAGARRIVAHVRDPRQATVSLVHHIDRYIIPDLHEWLTSAFIVPREWVEWDFPEKLDYVIEKYLPMFDMWIRGWMVASDKRPGGLEVKMTAFEDFVANEREFFDDLAQFFGLDRERVGSIDTPKDSGRRLHYRKGAADEWRESMSGRQQKTCLGLMSSDVIARFGWPAD